MTLQQAIEQACKQVARRDAEVLLQHVTGHSRASLLAYPDAVLSPEHTEPFFKLVARRATHEPLQYLTGHQEFFGLDFQVTPAVLIPRPETELLVEAALEWIAGQEDGPTPAEIVDVGTGSGAIALSLASRLPNTAITALDISPAALAIAEANARRLGLADRVHFLESDLLTALAPRLEAGVRWDLVISNPPYVGTDEAPEMQPEVRDHEPHLALFAEADGMSVYGRLVPQAWQALRPGGLLAMEFGFGQRPALQELLSAWNEVRFLDDYAGIPRVALALRP